MLLILSFRVNSAVGLPFILFLWLDNAKMIFFSFMAIAFSYPLAGLYTALW